MLDYWYKSKRVKRPMYDVISRPVSVPLVQLNAISHSVLLSLVFLKKIKACCSLLSMLIDKWTSTTALYIKTFLNKNLRLSILQHQKGVIVKECVTVKLLPVEHIQLSEKSVSMCLSVRTKWRERGSKSARKSPNTMRVTTLLSQSLVPSFSFILLQSRIPLFVP